MKIPKPNYTQIPNVFFDEMMHNMEKAELKVILYVMRRTFGFGKTGDRISLSQMCKGIVSKDGKVLDRGTGLSRDAVSRAITILEGKGLLKISREGFINYYSFNMTSHFVGLVLPSDSTSPIIRPKLVLPSDTQKKEKESIQKKERETPLLESIKYLENIPERDILEFSKTYKAGASKIREKAEHLYGWCIANGKTKKNYRMFLQTALLRDFGKRERDTLNF